METMSITLHDTLGLRDGAEALDLYEATFKPLAALAAQRHVMTAGEFFEVTTDARITKYLTRDDRGTLVGLGVQTTDLAAWPLISPEFFEAKWRDLYRQGHIWYVGFVCVRQEPKAPVSTFADLITHMSAPTRAVGGVSVMDFCTYNVYVRNLPGATARILRRLDPEVTYQDVDEQAFYAYRFSG